jgi:hypothetical protein
MKEGLAHSWLHNGYLNQLLRPSNAGRAMLELRAEICETRTKVFQ